MYKFCLILTGNLLFAARYFIITILLFLSPEISLALPDFSDDSEPSPEELLFPEFSDDQDTSPTENSSPDFLNDSDSSPAKLSLMDCPKCHSNIVVSIDTNGKSHKTKVTCTDCHEGHPPAKFDVIPACSKCHKEKEHFSLKNCLMCHTNPHTPLEITLSRTITGPCTTCHKGQLEQLQKYKSIHTTLDCTACHTSHGYLPPCFNCHGPHVQTMTNKICHDCHLPHMPLEVTYPQETPSEYCGACHKTAYSLLGKSRAKHRKVRCVECHEAVHKTIPECTKCHNPPPHSTSIIKERKCGMCHGTAHDLQLNKIDLIQAKGNK